MNLCLVARQHEPVRYFYDFFHNSETKQKSYHEITLGKIY